MGKRQILQIGERSVTQMLSAGEFDMVHQGGPRTVEILEGVGARLGRQIPRVGDVAYLVVKRASDTLRRITDPLIPSASSAAQEVAQIMGLSKFRIGLGRLAKIEGRSGQWIVYPWTRIALTVAIGLISIEQLIAWSQAREGTKLFEHNVA